MKTTLLIITALAFFGASETARAQCADIICPQDITVANDSTSCDAVVNFVAPTGIDTCNFISTTFAFTGAEQTWIVPAGITSITVDSYGAQGGANWVNNTNFGGHVQATLAVTPGTMIYVYVGEQPTTVTGGWNGGGFGETGGLGGGGASDIRIGGNTLNDRMIVAGAGGGGGYWNSQHVIGGAGGGLIGANGSRIDYATAPGGEGGTQTGSGNGTCASTNNPICTGSFGIGGNPANCGCEGYGGGGGWWGGAASGNCRGGGGGSSYTDPSATNVTHNQGVRAGNGEIIITYASNNTATTTQIAGLTSGSTFPLGTTINTFEVVAGTDTSWCSFNITVVDSLAPTIVAPSDVSVCDSGAVFNLAPSATDNCSTPTITYTISGATTGNGFVDASGTSFNFGVSTIWYYAVDPSGNADSSSMTVTVSGNPTVSISMFTVDSLCTNSNPINLPAATPPNGTYSGNGVAGVYFDPSQSGVGTHWVTYTYSDSSGCTNSDSTSIVVDACASLTVLDALQEVVLYPNPTHDQVTVSLSAFANAIGYTLHTADGKIVANGKHTGVQKFTMDLKKEEDGIYFLHLEIDGNQHVLRILKQ